MAAIELDRKRVLWRWC